MVARRGALLRQLSETMVGTTQVFACDLSQPEQALGLIPQCEQHFGPIDVLVNNAGQQPVVPAEQTDEQVLAAMLHLNLVTPLLMTRRVLPAMLARDAGTIVDVCSVAGLAPTPGMWGYNASKAGLGAASESLRGELRNTGVSVVTVYPGPVDTPMGRAGYAAYPAGWALRLLPQGEPRELARRIRTAVDLKQARVFYPRPYAVLRFFPWVARWALDRFTPRPVGPTPAALPPAQPTG